MTALTDEVIERARDLLNRVTFDDRGHIVAGKATGGNGGLLSRETLQAAEQLRRALGVHDAAPFRFGDRVRKTRGSSWSGLICGFYSTSLTPVGYPVESENEPGSVQIYPASALALFPAGADE